MSAQAGPGLDWNLLWQKAVADRRRRPGKPAQYWNRRAPSFAARKSAGAFPRAFLAALPPDPAWTVLDVGCGAGTLALPLAERVQGVTAIDFAEGMVELLAAEARERRLANIRALHLGWEDDWDKAGIGVHDLAIACRSLVVPDLAAAVAKLSAHARRKVAIVAPAGSGPVDRALVEALGRQPKPGPDYIYVYNYLHQIGVYAHVTMLRTDEEATFASPEEALAFYRVFLGPLGPDEDGRLRSHLDRRLVLQGGSWSLPREEPVRWAMIWWDQDRA